MPQIEDVHEIRSVGEDRVIQAVRSSRLPAQISHLYMGSHAGQQFTDREGFHQVIVRPGVQALDPRFFPARADSRITGVVLREGSLRIACSTPNPSSRGIITSVSTKAGHIPRCLYRLQAIGDGVDAILEAEQAAQVLAHIGIVVGDKDERLLLRRCISAGARHRNRFRQDWRDMPAPTACGSHRTASSTYASGATTVDVEGREASIRSLGK